MAYEFGASDLLATLGVTAADFEIQSVTPKTTTKQAVAKTRLNAFIRDSVVQFDEQTEYDLQLKAKTSGGATATFSIGGSGVGTGTNIVITRAAARMTANDYATLSITCHLHDTTTTHEGTPAATSITTPSLGFGIIALPAISGTLPDELQSADWSVEVEHKDYTTRTGTHLTGHSSAVKYTFGLEMVDSGTEPTLDTGWKLEESALPEPQDGLHMRRMSGYMYPAA
jgi:hypothetical protein